MSNGLNVLKSTMATNFGISNNPSVSMRSIYQDKINKEFEFGADVYTIQEETEIGSGVFTSVDVRINHAPVGEIAEKLGDDFKILIFKDMEHARGIGHKYIFNDSVWITTNSDIYKKATASCTIRRCNNVLRWVDENGVYYEEPCAIDYEIKENKDFASQDNLVLPSGFIKIYTQMNERTRKLKPSQRFLFGNIHHWAAFRVYANGVRNYQNTKTFDNDSSKMLLVYAGANYINNEADDLVNGIADTKQFSFVIETDPQKIKGNPTNKFEISSVLKMNGIVSDKPIIMKSTNEKVASVLGNIVTLKTGGECNIVCEMAQNPTVTTIIPVVVTGVIVQEYEVRIHPYDGYILQGDEQIFEVRLLLNGSETNMGFTFGNITTSIPAKNYSFKILDENNFSIENKLLYLDNPLVIRCTTTDGSHTRDFEIDLKGSW